MSAIARYEVKELSWPEKTFVAIRAHKTFDELKAFFPESYHSIYTNLEKAGMKPLARPCAIYYQVDETRRTADVAAAVPVAPFGGNIGFLEKIHLPASRLVGTTHLGSYDSLGVAYSVLDRYLAAHLLRRSLAIEEYLSDPAAGDQPDRQKTNIYYLVQPIATSN